MPGLTIDPSCTSPDASDSCRRIVVPNIPGEYPYTMKITFWGDQVYQVNGKILVQCPGVSLSIDPTYSLAFEVQMSVSGSISSVLFDHSKLISSDVRC